MKKLNFSGHESFHCRPLWLKKGFDFLSNGNNFNQPDAVVKLGVGKNMLQAIYYWMYAFNIIDSNKELTPFASYIFAENGKDQFLEDIGTHWLLHYHLMKKNIASIYSLVFNEFRKEKMEFTKDHLLNFLIRKCAEKEVVINLNTLNKDISVFFRNYHDSFKSSNVIDDQFSGLLIDLDLIEELSKVDENVNWYRIVNTEKSEIPEEILLYSIFDNHEIGRSISVNSLLYDFNSIGSIYSISSNGLINKIEKMEKRFQFITYKDTAGIREIQFKEKINKWEILDEYYQ